jgi:uncharacterized membrane protein YkvA (DUF1232 family)
MTGSGGGKKSCAEFGRHIDPAGGGAMYLGMSTTRISLLSLFGRSVFGRFLLFRKEASTLWRAFWHPETPLYLKGATLFAALYLFTPLDFVRDLFPPMALVDDFIIVPLMVSIIVKLLPKQAPAYAARRNGARTVDGDYRRL